MRRALFRDSLITLAAQVVMGLTALGSTVIVSRHLGPAAAGQFGLATLGMLTVTLLFSLGGPLVVTRHVADAHGRGAADEGIAVQRYAVRAAWLIWPVTLIIATALLASGWTGGLNGTEFAIAALGVGPGVMASLQGATLAGQQRFRELLTLATGVAVAQLAGTFGVALAGGGVAAFLVPVAAAPFFTAAGATILVRRTAPPESSADLPPQHRRRIRSDVASVSGITVLDQVIFQRSEVFFLAAMSSRSQIAYFTLAQALVSRTMSVIPGALAGVLLPKFAAARDPQALLVTSMRWLALTAMPLAALIIGLSPVIVRTAFGPEFAPMVPAMRVVAAAALFTALVTPVSSAIYAAGRQSVILRATLVAAPANILLAVLLIPPFGATGAAVAGGVTQVGAVLAGVAIARRTLDLTFPTLALFRTAGCATAAGGAAAAAGHLPLPDLVRLALGGASALGVFVVLAILTGAIDSDERQTVGALVRRSRRRAVPVSSAP